MQIMNKLSKLTNHYKSMKKFIFKMMKRQNQEFSESNYKQVKTLRIDL